jgi:hypothetical protein
MRKSFIVFFLLLSVCIDVLSQELKCNISANSTQIEGTNKKIFQTLNTALYEFMNNRSWTGLTFGVNERIECNILITIQQQVSADQFVGTIQIQSSRPVFNSSYKSILLNFKDENFNFKYVEYEPLEFNENMHQSNLTSVLAYYAYLIIGLDFDTFSLLGGSEYFNKADKIVTNAQGSTDKGWKPFEAKNNKNRYWLIKNILDKKYEPVRTFYYRFHRLGLDIMDSKPNEARAEIAEDMLLLQRVYRDKPDVFMYFCRVVFDAKSEAFVNIFSEAMPDEKNRVYQILNEVDNANGSKYKRIVSQ